MAAVTFDDDRPEDLAERIVREHRDSPSWLDRFTDELYHQRSAAGLTRILEVWGLSQADAARLFGVTRQAVAKWAGRGVPAERAAVVGDLAATTDVLVHYLKLDRIRAVVRRPADGAGGATLLELAASDPAAALQECRAMFDFAAVSA